MEEYDYSFYNRIEYEESAQALVVARFCSEHFSGRCAVVFGAGGGTYVRAFQECGFLDTIGYDFSDAGVEFAQKHGTKVIKKDLSIPCDFDVQYNIGVCLEVAEHISDKECKGLFSYFSCCSILIFSAAVPGQCGTNHINLKPKEEWKRLVSETGFYYSTKLTDSLLDCLKEVFRCCWIDTNLMVFENRKL